MTSESFTLPKDTVRMEHALQWRQHRKEREKEMTVICSVDQSAFTQYHQDEEKGEESREETLTVGKEAGVDFVSAGFVSW